VLVVDHANRAGFLRGDSGQQGSMDLVMALRHPPGRRCEDGVRFEIRFDKTRAHDGPPLQPLVVQLRRDETGAHWHWENARVPRMDRAVSLLRQGLSAETMARALGISNATAYRLQKRARELGWIAPRPNVGRPNEGRNEGA
jgi:hypothetical protein